MKTPHHFIMKSVCQADRDAILVRDLISESFQKRLNACPSTLKKHFLAVEAKTNGQAQIAAGSTLSFASEERLFSEYYLKLPIETTLKEEFGVDCDRSTVCEIGGLATHPDLIPSVKLIVAYFPWFAHRLGFKFALVTVTSYMREALNEAGVSFYPICNAEIKKLPEGEQSRWGRYYDFNPQTGILELGQLSFLNKFVNHTVDDRAVQIQLGCFGEVEECS